MRRNYFRKKYSSLFLFTMVLGLLLIIYLSYWARTNVYSYQEPFAELYFDQPDLLPNLMAIGDRQNVSFILESTHNETRDYTVKYDMELFNLYDLTENRYSCLEKIRIPYFLTWENNTNQLEFPRVVEQVHPLIVHPNFKEYIDWQHYNLTLSFGIPQRNGVLELFFADQDEKKYSIVFDSIRKQLLVNGQEVADNITLNNYNNNMEIVVNFGKLQIVQNRELLYEGKIEKYTGGQFGLTSQDAYFNIQRMRIRNNLVASVPDYNARATYAIDASLVQKLRKEYDELRKKSVAASRRFIDYNASIDCQAEAFYCEFFNLQNDIQFGVKEKNLSRIIEKLPVDNTDINYIISPLNSNKSFINWSDYTISFQHRKIDQDSNGMITIQFAEKWAILVTANNSYFIQPGLGGHTIDEVRRPKTGDILFDQVEVIVSSQKIELFINNKSIMTKQTPDDYTNGVPRLYIKNMIGSIPQVVVQNEDPVCFSEIIHFCEVEMNIGAQNQRVSQRISPASVGVRTYERESESLNLLLRNPNATNVTETEGRQGISLDIPISNPYINDKIITFTRRPIVEQTEFGLDYSYQLLDGAQVMFISFRSPDGKELAAYNLHSTNKMVFYYYDGQEESFFSIPYRFLDKFSDNLYMDINNNRVTYYFNNEPTYTHVIDNMTSGVFSVGAINTYAEFRAMKLHVENSTQTLSYREDPCELKTIYKTSSQVVEQIEPLGTRVFTKELAIDQEFDYGKVTITVPEDNLTVFFWVMRSD